MRVSLTILTVACLLVGCIPRLIICNVPALKYQNKKALKKRANFIDPTTIQRTKLYSITESKDDGFLYTTFLLYTDGTARVIKIPQYYNEDFASLGFRTTYQELGLDTIYEMSELEKFNLLLNSPKISFEGNHPEDPQSWGNWYVSQDTLHVSVFSHYRMCYSKVYSYSFTSLNNKIDEWKLTKSETNKNIGLIFKTDSNFLKSDSVNFAWRYWKRR